MNFCNFIQLVVEGEARLEEIRLQLANLEMFEPFTVFKRLDQQRTSALKIDQISEFLDDNTVDYNLDELNYIARVLDADNDSIITYDDFKSNILPKTNDQIRDQVQNHKSFDMPVGMLLPKEVELGMATFFKQLQQNYNQFLNIKEQIVLNDLDIYDKDGQISVESLQNWLQANDQQILDEILDNFVILINRNPQNLQNLIDLIYYQPEDQDQEEKNIEQSQEQPQDKQIEVQDINYQQHDIQQRAPMEESFNPNNTQQQQQQQQQQQKPEQKADQNQNKPEEQIVQSKILNESQKPKESPLLNYYNQQIREEEAKIRQLCEQLEIQDIYTSQRQESQIIKYYEKEIAREQEKLNKLLQETSNENSAIVKSSFTPQPLYIDDYQFFREKSLIDSQIRREEINLGLISSKIYSQPLTNSYLKYESPSKIQESYINSSFLNSKKPFNKF